MAIRYARFIMLKSDVSGTIPTVPTVSDHYKAGWIQETDIYEGELFLNTADNCMFTRCGDSILQVEGTAFAQTLVSLHDVDVSGSPGIQDGDVLVYDSATQTWIPGPGGEIGLSGYSGAAGASGTSGYSGAAGESGTSGYSGATGADGLDGISGASGYSGARGISGYSGAVGTSGYSGYEGTSGARGADGANTLRWNYGDTSWHYGEMIANDVNLASATVITLNEKDSGNVDRTNWNETVKDWIDAGNAAIMMVSLPGSATDVGVYYVDSVTLVHTNTDYYSYGLTPITGYGSFELGVEYAVSWVLSGPQGVQGQQGISGYSGRAGASGVSGYSGKDGVIGSDGASGVSGYSGARGISGYSGARGISGYSGVQGQSGYSGTSGFIGMDGANAIRWIVGTSGYNSREVVVNSLPPYGFIYATYFDISHVNESYINCQGWGDALFDWNGAHGWPAHLMVHCVSDIEKFGLYSITGTEWFYEDGTGQKFLRVSVSLIAGSGAVVLGDRLSISYSLIGASGYSGAVGVAGTSGTSGFSGATGPQGTSGTSGAQGASGVSGYSGASGYSGTSGTSGKSGYSGVSGTSGARGISGYSGAQGVSGYSGLSGTVGDDLYLAQTVHSTEKGVIYKDDMLFLHDFNYGSNGSVTTDGKNTFLGINAGNLTMGSTATVSTHSSYNTAVGYSVLTANTIGYSNCAFGYQTLLVNTEGWGNTAMGYAALVANITGTKNTAIGQQSMYANSTASSSTSFGYQSLYSSNAANNVAIGYRAAFAVSSGVGNTALGTEALRLTTTGEYNIGIGMYSLYGNTVGTYNVAIGYQSGRYISDGATANTTSDYSIYIGGSCRASADGNQGEIVIGNAAVGHGSNTVTLGDSNVTNLYLGNKNVFPGMAVALGSESATHSSSDSTALRVIYAPIPFTITAENIYAQLGTVGSTATTIDIHKNGATIFSTKITIDANEATNSTAATACVINGAAGSVSAGDKLEFFVDTAGTGCKGAKVILL